jgi:hypothetical protein
MIKDGLTYKMLSLPRFFSLSSLFFFIASDVFQLLSSQYVVTKNKRDQLSTLIIYARWNEKARLSVLIVSDKRIQSLKKDLLMSFFYTEILAEVFVLY